MAETVRVEKPSGVSVRTLSHGEESALLEILRDAFGSFADLPRTKAALSSRRFDSDGCFVAEENGVPIGWLTVTSLPRDKWFATKRPEFLRATTPAVQPYVEVYQKFGFKPLRRDFRISWQMDSVPRTRDLQLETEEVSEGTMDSASGLFVKALSPYWDWRTEEEGGITAVAESFKEDRSRGARWILARSGKEHVGLVGIIPDYYERGVKDGCLHVLLLGQSSSRGTALPKDRWQDRGRVPPACENVSLGCFRKVMHNPNIAY